MKKYYKYLIVLVVYLNINPIKAQQPDPPLSYMYNNVVIKTPLGSNVTASQLIATYELTSGEKAWIDNWATSTYPSATLISGSTRAYNCHGYAWHKSDGGSSYWINTPGDDAYWNDGSYVQSFNVSNNNDGVKISYYNSDHSAIKVRDGAIYRSKWGQGPLMEHWYKSCPYSTSGIRYYVIPVTGNDYVCTSPNTKFTTHNITGASYNWERSSEYLFDISGKNTYSYIVKEKTNGHGWVKVNLTSPYSGTTVKGKKMLSVGHPSYNEVQIYGPEEVCPNEYYSYYAQIPDFYIITDYHWYLPYGWSMISDYGDEVYVQSSNNTYDYMLMSPETNCELSEPAELEIYGSYWCDDFYSYNVYPNPANGGKLNVEVSIINNSELEKDSELKDFTFNLYSPDGELVKHFKSNSDKIVIDLIGLPSGIYKLNH